MLCKGSIEYFKRHHASNRRRREDVRLQLEPALRRLLTGDHSSHADTGVPSTSRNGRLVGVAVTPITNKRPTNEQQTWNHYNQLTGAVPSGCSPLHRNGLLVGLYRVGESNPMAAGRVTIYMYKGPIQRLAQNLFSAEFLWNNSNLKSAVIFLQTRLRTQY